jgi:hypothetical protein
MERNSEPKVNWELILIVILCFDFWLLVVWGIVEFFFRR